MAYPFAAEQHHSLCLEMQVLLGSVEYVDPPNALTPMPVAAPGACREGVGEDPAHASYIDSWK